MNELFSYYGLIINNILYILASKRIVRYKVYKFMIIRFIVDNFLSFDKETEFNMIAGNFKIHQNHVYKYGKIDILKSSAVYGANASGKSNLIKAIFTMQQIIKKGKINKSIKTEKFKLNPENISKPTIFEIEIVVDKHFYNYGFSFENDIITEEWLYETGASKPKMIFTRELLKNGQ
ncbi:MAG: uncharacterized protein QG635_2305, partial [Bacteroidota bacterium]|nr:uncharacterized protein [Bacteroidota bacterium]